MQFGLQINPYSTAVHANPWDSVAAAAQVLDASAFDSLWIYDHFLYEGGNSGHPFPEPIMECFTTLGAIAAITGRPSTTFTSTPPAENSRFTGLRRYSL